MVKLFSVKNKCLIIISLFTIHNLHSISCLEKLKWVPILALPALTLHLIKKGAYNSQNEEIICNRLSYFPATFFLSACDRIIDKNPSFEKYYVDLVRNGLSLLLCNMLYAYQHGERKIKSRDNKLRIISAFEPLFGIMPGVTSSQLARYVSVFKFVNYIFKNVLKLHVEPMHI